MPRIPIFRLGGSSEKPALPNLSASTPYVALEGLMVGVDNLRHDVVLSPRFVELARAQIARLIARHGELEGLLGAEAPQSTSQAPSWLRAQAGKPAKPKLDPGGWKSALAELQVASLNRAKKEFKLSVDLLARLAVTKFLRGQMNLQFAQVVERGRVLLKNYDNSRIKKNTNIARRSQHSKCRRKSFSTKRTRRFS